MRHTSEILIDAQAYRDNLSFIQSMLEPTTLFSSVVKGNAYGHGYETFIPLACASGVSHFSVFSTNEAQEVLNHATSGVEIMIMGDIDYDQIDWVIAHDISFFVFELDRLKRAISAAIKLCKKAKIHIEFETGMNRTGFNQHELESVKKIILQNQEHILLEGFCTHFAGAESIANYVRVTDQLALFNQQANLLKQGGLSPRIEHTACSAASIAYPDSRKDLVRIGILQYGFWPSIETFVRFVGSKTKVEDPLSRLITWKSRVMSVKNVSTGSFIGYGTSFLAQTDMTIATVPVGYAHGYARGLSNTGRVLIRGKRVPVIGVVNMNALTIDVSELDHVEKGDEVVLIGKQGDVELSVSSFSALSDQLNYELLTRLPHSIPRTVINT